MIRIPYCDGYLFRIGKARFVYSHELDNFVLAAYNEEIIDRQHPGLDSRIINYDLPEKPMMLSAFSPCTVRNKTETLYYKNDTISQELIIRKINERRIYFVLSSQKTDREGKRNIKAMLPYPITLTGLRKQMYRKMASCIRLLNIGMKMKISLCQ